MLTDTRSGYGWISIALHWLAAIAIIYLFIDGNQMEDLHDRVARAAIRDWHMAIGATLSILLLARVLWRVRSGAPEQLPGPPMLNRLAKAIHIGLVLTILAAVGSGLLLPWSMGNPIPLLGGLSIPSPLPQMHWLHEAMEGIHSVSVHLFIPLVALHVLGALKHAVIDRDGTMQRMLRPGRSGTPAE
ncbi:MAG: cytochrome b [Hyphomicrobiaceae bacterium]